MRHWRSTIACIAITSSAWGQGSFVNWETPHVSPLALTPDGSRLLAVNTADDRLEVIDLTGVSPTHVQSIPVGLDPVSVRARTNDEVWVVNHISDSVSVVRLSQGAVVRTIDTDDEPADVVFAGAPERAFVSCSQANTVLVFDPQNPTAPPTRIEVAGEDPRALAVSPNGQTVYAAIFESGNGSTVLGGGSTMTNGFPPNVVSAPQGPYGGMNPPPNSGNQFSPPIKAGLPTPPKVSLIVKKNTSGQWIDDNNGDWTSLVSGSQSALSGRPSGWDVIDRDVAIIDTNTLNVTYATRLMNICMALAVHPITGDVIVVGTDATNEIRFEPNLNGVFLRVRSARVGAGGVTLGLNDLNSHLTYTAPTVPLAQRLRSLGDPRGIAWDAAGSKGFVTGMGSNNLIVVDATGQRVGTTTIDVGEGPTGVVFHAASNRLFVLNRFGGSISVVDPVNDVETGRLCFFDPTPSPIKVGRKHLYDTHANSGLGHVACASCHVDARMDRLAWDLGDPQGSVKSVSGQNLSANIPGLQGNFEDWHPMKGPMTTQTLQDIIGREPLHWRGDRDGIEEFNPAFTNLQGHDAPLTPAEMQEFEDFLATIYFPPNPYRNLDNSLPSELDTKHVSPGRFSPKGTPLPIGNAMNGLQIYRPPFLLDAVACSTCHTLPSGIGTDAQLVRVTVQPFPVGPNGEHHHALVSVDGSTNVSLKIPHLRNMHEKVGMSTATTLSRAGFGYIHDGSVDTIAQFVSEPVFNVASDQQIADLTAFMLSFAGGDLPYGSSFLEPPAALSQHTHAAVGKQTTVIDGANPAPGQFTLIDAMLQMADAGKIGVVVKGTQGGIARGYRYNGGGTFQSDRAAESKTTAQLKAAAAPGAELTWTVVPIGSQTRIGIDRDQDGAFDRDELDAGSNPADAGSTPGCGMIATYGTPEVGSLGTPAKIFSTGGDPMVGSATFAVAMSGGRPNQFCVLFTGGGEGANVQAWGTILVKGPGFTRTYTTTDATGATSLAIPIAPAMAGTTQYFQFAVRDPGFGGDVQATDGLKVTYCP